MTATDAAGKLAVDRRWVGYDGLFGGYVVGLLVDAAVAHSRYDLASISANFVSVVPVGDVSVEVDRLHGGRSTEVLRLVVEQAGLVQVHATAEFVHVPAPNPMSGQPPARVRSTSAQEPPAAGRDVGRVRLPFDDLVELRPTAPPRVASETTTWAESVSGQASRPALRRGAVDRAAGRADPGDIW